MLFESYFLARKKKRKSFSQISFEVNFEKNIFDLYQEIISKKYIQESSNCFIINKPVKREIFAASFRDRVVHHFIFKILNPLIEKKLLYDVYSCRKGKGTFFGVDRATSAMQSISDNFKKDAYVLKLDISGYFMNINKDILYHKVMNLIDKNEIDLPIQSNLIKYLVKVNIYNSPTDNCRFRCGKSQWKGLPDNKSLFKTPFNCGLAIGNLTSQLYGNLYLSDFDHYVKKELQIKKYGRYVDDLYFFDNDRLFLASVINSVKKRLFHVEKLELHPKKIYLQNVKNGFLFLGIYILPYRRYIGKRIKKGLYNSLNKINQNDDVSLKELERKLLVFQSYCSILKHYNCFKLLRNLKFVYLPFVLSKCNYKNVNIPFLKT